MAESFVYLRLQDMLSKEYILSTLRSQKLTLRELGIRDVGLFGSFARDDQSGQSDIDILVDFESGKESFDSLMSAYDLFEEIFEPYKVEIVTKNGLSPYIGPRILNEVKYA